MNYFNKLSKYILYICPDGLTKVRFAKMIYLVHKALVQKNKFNPDELKFIRMPLGPVPYGFKNLVEDNDIVISEAYTALSYNRQTYKLKEGLALDKDSFYEDVKEAINNLKSFLTSQLVEYTHGEPSWLNHSNGKEYFITKEDLKRQLPKKGKHLQNVVKEDQLLQAYLVDGMIDDIVEESTTLEYPKG